MAKNGEMRFRSTTGSLMLLTIDNCSVDYSKFVDLTEEGSNLSSTCNSQYGLYSMFLTQMFLLYQMFARPSSLCINIISTELLVVLICSLYWKKKRQPFKNEKIFIRGGMVTALFQIWLLVVSEEQTMRQETLMIWQKRD